MEAKLHHLTKPLSKEDIEIRIGNCSENGASFLLYKTARVDTKRFNDVFGLNWKREHRIENGRYICRVSIFNEETKEWIVREDVGTESNTEKEKGAFSDAFKRACSAFGSGIELYEAPFIFIQNITEETAPKSQKYKLKNKFYDKDLIIQKYEYSTENGLLIEIYNTSEKKTVFSNFPNNHNKEKPTVKTEFKKTAQENIFEEYKELLLNSKNLTELKNICDKISKHQKSFSKEELDELRKIKDNLKTELASHESN